jgi:putative MATE family efflux protein
MDIIPNKNTASLKEVLKTSFPAVIDLSSQTITWLIEAAFIGHLSALALAGVGIAQQFIILTFSILLTFVVGSSIIIVHYLGAGDKWNANHVLGQALFISVIISFIIGLFWYFAVPLLFNLIKDESSLAQNYGIVYIKTVALFSPLIITNFIAMGILRGIGDTMLTMTISLIVNSINLALDAVLIFGWLGFPRLETFGAGLAVGIAHSVGFIITLVYLRNRKSSLFLAVAEITRPKISTFKKLFKMGLPTTVEQFVWATGQIVLSFFAARISVTALAVHQVLVRVQSVMTMVYWGFGIAGMSLVGKNIGAKQFSEARKNGRIVGLVALVTAIILAIVLYFFSGMIISVFTANQDVIRLGKYVILALVLLQLPRAVNTTYAGNLRGAADLNWLMWLAIASVIINEITGAYLLSFTFGFGLIGLWIIQIFDESGRLVLNYRRFNKLPCSVERNKQ